MQLSRPPLRRSFTNLKIPTVQQRDLFLNVACMYSDIFLYVVVTTKNSLHSPKLAQQRSKIIEHLLSLLSVPLDKQHRVFYIERYTHLPQVQWLKVKLNGNKPATVEPASDSLIQKLQVELLDKIELMNR